MPDTVVFDLVDAVLSELAPDEQRLFAGLRGSNLKLIERRLLGSGQRDDPLGFGVGEAVDLLAPTLWVAIKAAAEEQAGNVAKKGFSLLLKRLGTALRKRLRREKPAPVSELSEAELTLVHEKVLAILQQNGVVQASAFADSVCYQLRQATNRPTALTDGA